MFEEVNRVKERRRERMDRLRTQPRDSFAPFVDDWKDPIDDDLDVFPLSSQANRERMSPSPPQEKWSMQIAASLLLIGLAYLLFQSSLLPSSWQIQAREVMTRDFNFSGAANWYTARFGSLPTLLPSMTGSNAVPAATPKVANAWKWPTAWRVVKPFDPQNTKVVLSTEGEGAVVMGEPGWVTYIGDKPGYGKTVVVRLTKGRELWFGNMDQVKVTVDEFLAQGQVIGVPRLFQENSRHLYLGMFVQEKPDNPLEVISFE
ncbi:M23 family metallopeptidase [Brevibacillus ruminantium]|uniref:M23 family metallopeptidase n=1 Tax=Brevibacillus ruminantium TaxID=2950604 RepID=A0ABY4WAQ5_9BACL|nr:M23 family metallopeptidase [Brevibacillus ruminantium]USG64128.1 M23 family metallopeptidase [Brevibacillus ruminantium]